MNKIKNIKFTKCSNSKCNAIILCDVNEIEKDVEIFCKNCSEEILHSHIVQCKSCQTIVNFIPAMRNEEPIVFYVEKCSFCSGTIKDEAIFPPQHLRDSFM